MRRFGRMMMVGLIAATSAGCALTHELQPHRLWRWNRGTAPSSDPYFSISDPLPHSALRRASVMEFQTANDDPAHAEPVAGGE